MPRGGSRLETLRDETFQSVRPTIQALLGDGRAEAFEGDDIARIVDELRALRATLLVAPAEGSGSATKRARTSRRRSPATAAQVGWLPDGEPAATDPASVADRDGERLYTADEVMAALDGTLERMGPRYDIEAFDAIIRAWRRRRYPQ